MKHTKKEIITMIIMVAVLVALLIACVFVIKRYVDTKNAEDKVFSVTVPMQLPYQSPHPFNVADGI